MGTIKGTYDFAKHPGMGLVVLSTSLDNPEACRLWPEPLGNLFFRSATVDENGKPYRLRYLLSGGAPEFFVKEVPAGYYRLESLNISMFGGAAWTDAPVPHSFSVEAGEVVYLGELTITLDGYISGQNCPITNYKTLLKNQWERDRKWFKRDIENIDAAAAQVRLLSLPEAS
ncbi:hypothetical protein KYC5002_39600 [Archangium violaceum]|uniref:hypothetical protein n=1 Tax=Archangium violaceum TaxID=83451 RepID=UPI002B306708|nr:hypothetical protein KYC5002_39600 [Archangium gephyra]